MMAQDAIRWQYPTAGAWTRPRKNSDVPEPGQIGFVLHVCTGSGRPVASPALAHPLHVEIGFVLHVCLLRRQHSRPRLPVLLSIGLGQIGFVCTSEHRARGNTSWRREMDQLGLFGMGPTAQTLSAGAAVGRSQTHLAPGPGGAKTPTTAPVLPAKHPDVFTRENKI